MAVIYSEKAWLSERKTTASTYSDVTKVKPATFALSELNLFDLSELEPRRKTYKNINASYVTILNQTCRIQMYWRNLQIITVSAWILVIFTLLVTLVK